MHDNDTRPCNYCGKAMATPQEAYAIEGISEIFDLLWCNVACAKADLDQKHWESRLRHEQAIFEQMSRESGPQNYIN